jgi:hypothetical protein
MNRFNGTADLTHVSLTALSDEQYLVLLAGPFY